MRKPAGYKQPAPAGHYRSFKHPHMTRSTPIGVEKLYGVFMNVVYNSIVISLNVFLYNQSINRSFKLKSQLMVVFFTL